MSGEPENAGQEQHSRGEPLVSPARYEFPLTSLSGRATRPDVVLGKNYDLLRE
jgi:hypothetical protein